MLFAKLPDFLRGSISGYADDQLMGGIIGFPEVTNIIPGEVTNTIRSTQDIIAQRVIPENNLFELIIDLLFRRVAVGIQFVQEHTLFFFPFTFSKGSTEHHTTHGRAPDRERESQTW